MICNIHVIWQILSLGFRIWKSSQVKSCVNNGKFSSNDKCYRKGVFWRLHAHGLHNGSKLLHTIQIRLFASFLGNVEMNATLALMVPSPSLSNNWKAFLISCNISLTVLSSIKGFILSFLTAIFAWENLFMLMLIKLQPVLQTGNVEVKVRCEDDNGSVASSH